MTILVDSDVLIEVSRGRNAEVVSKWRELMDSGAAVLYSPVSVAELWSGALPREHEALDALFRALVSTPIGTETGRRAGIYLKQFRKSHAVEIADALVAACAVGHRAELWTRNRKHYPMKDVTFFD
jgi:predicted nucleic acid-binding protein